MAYCTVDDVRALNKNREYSATSEVTIDNVNDFIKFISSEIEGKLKRRGYKVPVTGLESKAILRWINALGAAAMAEEAQFHGTVEPGISTHAERLWAQYKERLNGIVDGSIFLRDAEMEATIPVIPVSSGLWSFNQENFGFPDVREFDPIFKMEEKW